MSVLSQIVNQQHNVQKRLSGRVSHNPKSEIVLTDQKWAHKQPTYDDRNIEGYQINRENKPTEVQTPTNVDKTEELQVCTFNVDGKLYM